VTVSELDIAIASVGGIVIILGVLSQPIKRTFLSAPLLAMASGIALGPAGLDLLVPQRWGEAHVILEEACRLTIAIGLMGVALRLPPKWAVRNWRSMAVLLGLAMPLMWLSAGLLAYWVLNIPLLPALLLGAVVTPTDPIVATSIVTGPVAEEHLPERLRHTLSSESGLNDGLAAPIVFGVMLMLMATWEEGWSLWLGQVLLRESFGGLALGAALGYLGGQAMQLGERWHTLESPSYLSFTVALTLLTLGVSELLGVNALFAVFVAGLVFDMGVGGSDRNQEEKFQEAVNQFFTLPIFTLFGMILPWDQWRELGWKGVLLAAAVLMLRRMPVILLLHGHIPQLRGRVDALFAGWFGPIGIAALLYALTVLEGTSILEVWSAGSLIVFSSILVHGVTATPFTRWYGRRQGIG
jgi:sodium/hydrogen antiporter